MKETRLKSSLFLQGVATLISWGAVLSSIDWFAALFPDYNVGLWLSICNFSLALVIQPVNAIYGSRYSSSSRINLGYLLTGTSLLSLPLFAGLWTGTLGFQLVCGLIMIMGAGTTVTQTTIYGLAATLPPHISNYMFLGNGTAGLIITSLRFLCLTVFQGHLFTTTIVYFSISAVSIGLGMTAQVYMMRLPILNEEAKASPLLGIESSPELYETKQTLGKSLWEYMFLVWLCHFVTFGVLTHVAIATESALMNYTYFSTLMFWVYNLFDFLGRWACAYYRPRKIGLWAGTILRFLFWVSFIVFAGNAEVNTFVKFANMAGFAFSHGYMTACIMVEAPTGVASQLKDLVGHFTCAALLLGIVSGTGIGFCFKGIGYIPIE